MKSWGWKNWLMFGVLVTLFVVAGVLVIVGVVTHEEPGFASPENSWGHTPLSVTCQGYVDADDDACSVVEDVVGVVNSRLDFNMLVWTEADPGETGDIHFTMNAPVEVGSDGPCGAPGECFELTGTSHDSTYTRCMVQTMNVAGGGDLQWLVTYHGVGHCLGLAHDDYDQSIMRPTQRPTPDRALPPWISDYDRGLLRDRYAP